MPSSAPPAFASTDRGSSSVLAGDGRPVVWLLDDSPLESAMARRALVAHYDIELFSDGSALIERLAAGSEPAVLVLDWHMPGMSGIEVCRFIRSRKDESSLPILMLTVYGHKGDLVEGLAAGANDYVTKPYNALELAARVATLVRIKTLHEQARRAESAVSSLLAGERSARAEAEAANAAKDDFLAMVSHELRTPLNAILGWARMARSGELGAGQQGRALETIERNANSQMQLIEELLDMSRIVSGKFPIERASLDLATLLKDAVEALRPAALTKGVALEARIAGSLSLVTGDSGRLQQVFSNLLANALKFTPAGGQVTLDVADDAGEVRVRVADSGIGIDPAFLGNVFERFRQFDSGSTRVHGGLGLGLAIVKHIVEMHGGSVSASSEGTGRGAEFTVRLPMARASSPASVTPPPDGESGVAHRSGRLSPLRILVVDDDADALELMQILLENHGAKVTLALSAGDAFDTIMKGSVDIVVSDIGMPHEDGYAFLRRLRAQPVDRGGRTPAVALTAFAHADDRAAAFDAGFDAYVSKPLDLETLLGHLETLARRVVAPV